MDDPGDPTGDRAGDPFRDPTLDAAVATQGPLGTDVARRLIERGRAKLDAGDSASAIMDFQRVVGHEDPEITGAALLGLGDALYRLDDEPQAAISWQAATQLRDNSSTYRAWRNLAGVLVRSGDLKGAINAYREADGYAPAEDKPEIAARLGWLAKETGNTGAASRYFARSRGTASLGLAQLLVIVTSVISLAALVEPTGELFSALLLDPAGIRNGELYRLVSVALVHAPGAGGSPLSLHLLLNMYALWIVGPIVEQAWGKRLFVGFYVLAAIGASAASFVFSGGPAVGASGAVFGLVGVILAGTRAHHPQLDRRARALVPQLGMFVIINLVFGFAAGGMIDNAAHIGGLVAGLWLGFLVPPGKVPTLRSAWQHPRGTPGAAAERPPILIAAGIFGLLGVITALLAYGNTNL